MRVYGITGGSGSGKTTLLTAAKALGAEVLDCDAIYHTLLKENPVMVSRIGARFPDTVQDGVLNRRALAKLVFGDNAALCALNAITHPFVVQAVRARLAASTAPFGVIDAIGLLESDLLPLCTATVAVTAPLERRLSRLTQRDGISSEEAMRRIGAQKPDEYYVNHCDYRFENNYTALPDCEQAARALWIKLREEQNHV